MTTPILEVKNLQVNFSKGGKLVAAVDGVGFSILRGEMVAIVGESGCGKSVLALSIMRLIEFGGGKISRGDIQFMNMNLCQQGHESMRKIRGKEIAMIFQEPMTSLNPVFTIGEQIAETFRLHEGMSRASAWEAAIQMLDQVKIPAARQRASEFPHQLSGGMRQRVMIAMALACKPKMLIADEPTTALDVTIQAQILRLLVELQEDLGMAVLLITHDLGVVAETCSRTMVMYGGKIVESANTQELFAKPCHPYTQGLLLARPQHGHAGERLAAIPGNVPTLGNFPDGCRFRNRCSKVFEKCVKEPDLRGCVSVGHEAACWLY